MWAARLWPRRLGPAGSAVRRHEDRKSKTGEMMQRLVDADQRPEPRMLQMHIEGGGTKPLGAIDDDVNDEIDQREKPESRCDDQQQRHRDGEMDQTMRQQWQRPSGFLVLA